MTTTGILQVSSGISQLNGIRLARQGEQDPFTAATNFLANRNLNNNAFIRVDGSNGFVGNVPVIFIISAVRAASAVKTGRGAAKKAGAGPAAKKAAAKKATPKKAATKKRSAKKSGKRAAKKSTSAKSRKGSTKR